MASPPVITAPDFQNRGSPAGERGGDNTATGCYIAPHDVRSLTGYLLRPLRRVDDLTFVDIQ